MTAAIPIPYSNLENSVLELPVAERCRLTHVLIRSIDEAVVMEPGREGRWADFAEKVDTAIGDGRMATADAFEALARLRRNLAQQTA
jgi:hypothetical protein